MIIEQVNGLREEISRAEIQKDKLSGLRLMQLVGKPLETESPKNMSTQKKPLGSKQVVLLLQEK